MKHANRYIQDEMDIIIFKTYKHVQQVLEEQGVEHAKELIEMIANDIKKQLLDSDMSITDVEQVYEQLLEEINAVVFEKKH